MSLSGAARWKDRLRQARIERNWRQHEVAERLGASVLTVQRWERGSHLPSAYFRVKLCALFGKSAEELGFVAASKAVINTPETRTDASGEPTSLRFPSCLEYSLPSQPVFYWSRRPSFSSSRAT